MSEVGDRDAVVRALIEREHRSEDDKPAVVGEMQRLCRAATRSLSALGVGVTLISAAGPQVTVAASGEQVELIEELQFSLGEGPCFEAYGSRRPVLIPDLLAVASTRWPGYAAAAQEHGVRAVFAFPLQIGAARLGVMDIYNSEPGNLSIEALGQALTFAEVATGSMLDGQLAPDSRDHVLHRRRRQPVRGLPGPGDGHGPARRQPGRGDGAHPWLRLRPRPASERRRRRHR